MRSRVSVFILFILISSCHRDSPRHHVKEMIGTYYGTWTFMRNTGNTSEPGMIEVMQGSQKNTVYVGPELAEFELNEDLDPIILGNSYKLSFPNGSTDMIQFERYLHGQFGEGTDIFVGTK